MKKWTFLLSSLLLLSCRIEPAETRNVEAKSVFFNGDKLYVLTENYTVEINDPEIAQIATLLEKEPHLFPKRPLSLTLELDLKRRQAPFAEIEFIALPSADIQARERLIREFGFEESAHSYHDLYGGKSKYTDTQLTQKQLIRRLSLKQAKQVNPTEHDGLLKQYPFHNVNMFYEVNLTLLNAA